MATEVEEDGHTDSETEKERGAVIDNKAEV